MIRTVPLITVLEVTLRVGLVENVEVKIGLDNLMILYGITKYNVLMCQFY
jgi:hypothetical protein